MMVHPMDEKYLPPTSPLSPHVASPATKSSTHKKRRDGYLLRLGIYIVLASGAGYLLGLWLLPKIPQKILFSYVAAHVLSVDSLKEMPQALPILNLFLASLPVFLLLCVAGLTGFCRSLLCHTSSLLGLCQGFSLSLLVGYASTAVCILYGGWMIWWLGLRMLVAYTSCYTQSRFFDPQTRLPQGKHGLSPLMVRHMTFCLIAMAMLLLSCGAYVKLMYILL